MNKVIAYKAFNSDWTCRDFQYEVGKTYRHDGKVEMCGAGFHACEFPFDCWGYYPPTGKLAEVEMTTHIKDGDKSVTGEITIRAELSLPQFIQRGVEAIIARAKSKEANTGDRSAATNTGDWSAATNTGDRSAATVEGANSIALASGFAGRVSGAEGCALFLVERGADGEILHAWAGIAGRDGIKPSTFYTLRNGQPEEAA